MSRGFRISADEFVETPMARIPIKIHLNNRVVVIPEGSKDRDNTLVLIDVLEKLVEELYAEVGRIPNG